MNEIDDIKQYQRLIELIGLFQKVSQLSWISDQTKKRYPMPESMSKEEMEQLMKVFLALGSKIEQIYEDWLSIKKEYESNTR